MYRAWTTASGLSRVDAHIFVDEGNSHVQNIELVAPSSNYSLICAQMVRALRGRRSQALLSRRLGYRSNAVRSWEVGASFPPASRVFHLAEQVGVDLSAGIQRFFREVPPALLRDPLTTQAGVVTLVRELRGRARIGELADAGGLSRFAISRWLSGKAQPRLPDLLCFVDHAALRLLDFIAIFTNPTKVQHVAEAWHRLQKARQLGYQRPGTHAVLHALETTVYQADPTTATVAGLTGMPEGQVVDDLAQLEVSDQVRWNGQRHVPGAIQSVDFRREPAAAQQVKAYWAQLAADRTRERRSGLFAFNVFAVSREDLRRLVDLQRSYLREMRTIIAQSEPSEVVALSNVQLFSLGDQSSFRDENE